MKSVLFYNSVAMGSSLEALKDRGKMIADNIEKRIVILLRRRKSSR